jgi:hypothetical protein
MLTLRELQTAFCQSVSGVPPSDLLQLIAPDGFDPAARLAIYRNNVVTRLTDTLITAFPVVCELVDRRFFDYAAAAFLRQHLPASGCLSDYGGEFPSFLADFPPAAEPKYLADVARLEWAIHKVLHAAAAPTITLATFGAVTGDLSLLKLRLVPAVRYIASRYPVDRIWIAHQERSTWSRLQLGDDGVRLQISGGRGLTIVDLPASTWEFRARLAGGETLGTAVEKALAVASNFDTPSALAALFGDELVTSLT